MQRNGRSLIGKLAIVYGDPPTMENISSHTPHIQTTPFYPSIFSFSILSYTIYQEPTLQ